MPLGEIVGHVLLEVVVEIVIKGPGFLIARQFKPGIDPDGKWSILCGLVFWLLVGGLGYLAWRALAAD
jgi:hypothetical protein